MHISNRDVKRYVVELFGTFVLTLIVSLILNSPLGALAPLMAAFIVGLFVYTVGHVSGAHFNPAVSIGAWSIGKIKPIEAVIYMIAQFAGAALSILVVSNVLGLTLIGSPIIADRSQMLLITVAEMSGMFLFAFGIASVVFGKVPEAAKGLVIGTSLFIGLILSSGLGASGVINPAVAFGINSFSWMYVVGPIVGSVAGMWAYKWLAAN